MSGKGTRQGAGAGSVLRATLMAIAALLVPASAAGAHEGVHEQEDRLLEALTSNPNDASLHVRLGQIQAKKEEWDAAIASYERAAQLGGDAADIGVLEGTAYLGAGWPRTAIVRFERVLASHPQRFDAYLGRGRAWMQLQKPAAAADDFATAFGGAARPQPAHVIEWRDALVAAGRKEEALEAVDRGVARVGPLPLLQIAAVDLAVELKRYEEALQRLDRMLERYPQHAIWLARRAEILEQAGRPEDAALAYRKALDRIEALDAIQKKTPRLAKLEKKLRTARQELEKKTTGTNDSKKTP